MKTKIYSPDIECDSCTKILKNAFEKMQGIQKYEVAKNHIEVEYDESLIQPQNIIEVIKEKGYKASFDIYTKKSIKERAKEFVLNKEKYKIEYLMLKNIAMTFIGLLILDALLIYFKSVSDPLFFGKYVWWLFYLTISVVAIMGAIWHFKAYKTQYTCMVGMMVGMTIGMQTGFMIGAVIGATNGFFIGAIVAMILGCIVGAYCGSSCGIMGIMEGLMAGLMGGTMGPMITVMMFNEKIFWFMPIYMAINIIILIGLIYMIFEEVVEDREVAAKPMSLNAFFYICLAALAALSAIMIYAKPSIFLV